MGWLQLWWWQQLLEFAERRIATAEISPDYQTWNEPKAFNKSACGIFSPSNPDSFWYNVYNCIHTEYVLFRDFCNWGSVQNQLKDVMQIKSSNCGFSALVDGEPITWGNTEGDGIFSDFDSQDGESDESCENYDSEFEVLWWDVTDVRQFDMLLCLVNSADWTDLSARCGATPSIPYAVNAEKR